ncbi:MAG: phage tail protein [Lachnospiraceae bacterium]|nr:phage tail protein [Lachnospiraceae bacterium]
MTVGSLGDIIFSVSSEKIETLTNLKISGSANYGKHQLHGGDTVLEFTGRDADQISFEMTLAERLGVNVEEELEKIENAVRSGEALTFVIGKKIVGNYKWVITKYTVNMKQFDRELVPVLATVSLSLSEYVQR